jgi:hypothetical protein
MDALNGEKNEKEKGKEIKHAADCDLDDGE